MDRGPVVRIDGKRIEMFASEGALPDLNMSAMAAGHDALWIAYPSLEGLARIAGNKAEFLASVEGQQAIPDSYALEYPLNPEVSLDPPVKPFNELEPPQITIGAQSM